MMAEDKLTILVLARDQTSKLAYLTSYFIDKYWNDRKYNLVLCTQTQTPQKSNYDQVIYGGEKAGWADRLEIAVRTIQSDYILFTLEDFLLRDFIKPGVIEDYLEKMFSDKDISAIRLVPSRHFVDKYDNRYNYVKKGKPYRICGQPTIFRRDYLLALAEKKYSPWQFEIDGSEYSNLLDGKVLVVRKKEYDCVHAWSRGAWTREAISLFKREKIDKKLYEDEPVYPILRYMVGFVWSIAIDCFPSFLVSYSKKRNRQN